MSNQEPLREGRTATPVLWPHQQHTLELARASDIVFDTSAAGTGKTGAWASAIEARSPSRTLVVCPKTLIHAAWVPELTLFTPDLTVVAADPPIENREASFGSDSDIVLINYEALPWLEAKGRRWLINRLGANPMLIADESSYAKNPNASRTKALMKLAPQFRYRSCLSGTPAPNTVVELWPQVFTLDLGERYGTRFGAFRMAMQYSVPMPGFTKWVDRREAVQLAYDAIADITIGHSFDDVMKHVPPMDYRLIHYELPDKHLKLYREMEVQSYAELEGKTVTAVNAGVLANKLLQIASGAVYVDPSAADDGDHRFHLVDHGRYSLIVDLVDARPHSLVFFRWRHQRDVLSAELKRRGISYGVLDSSVTGQARAKVVADFQAGKLRTILLHPKTGAHGLTLTRGISTIFCSPVYEADVFVQGNARVRRGSQSERTESIVVVADGTLDMHAYQTFTGKKSRMDGLNELLQRVQQ
jgi:SNF2 family DNA or RNA helicase